MSPKSPATKLRRQRRALRRKLPKPPPQPGEAKAAAQTQRDTLYARTAAFLAHRRQHYTGPQADALTLDELQTALQAQHDSLRRGLAEVHDRMADAESRKKIWKS